MFYLTNGEFYLADYGNGDRAYFSDKFSDRHHFLTKPEAEIVAQILQGTWGILTLHAEDPSWLMGELIRVFDREYRKHFNVRGPIRLQYFNDLKILCWEVPTMHRVDRIYKSLELDVIYCHPVEHVQLTIRPIDGILNKSWKGLDRAFVDRDTRSRLEFFLEDFRAILTSYWSALEDLKGARSSR